MLFSFHSITETGVSIPKIIPFFDWMFEEHDSFTSTTQIVDYSQLSLQRATFKVKNFGALIYKRFGILNPGSLTKKPGVG